MSPLSLVMSSVTLTDSLRRRPRVRRRLTDILLSTGFCGHGTANTTALARSLKVAAEGTTARLQAVRGLPMLDVRP